MAAKRRSIDFFRSLLDQAITAHASAGSEANRVIFNFEMLSPADRQALLNFLRAL